MTSTTLGVKVDEALRARIRAAAQSPGRTRHWHIKQSIFAYLEQIESGKPPSALSYRVQKDAATGNHTEDADVKHSNQPAPRPFYDFAQSVAPQTALRAAITAVYRRPEEECVPLLLNAARQADPLATQALARKLVEALRSKRSGGGVEGLIHEFSLSSQEGVALMCLAEALLRIPDEKRQLELVREVVRSHMSVKQLEAQIQRLLRSGKAADPCWIFWRIWGPSCGRHCPGCWGRRPWGAL